MRVKKREKYSIITVEKKKRLYGNILTATMYEVSETIKLPIEYFP